MTRLPSTTSQFLSLNQARAIALRAQGLGRRWSTQRPIDVLRQLGFIQLDSVNVVQRTHWIVPFSRLGPYSTKLLHEQVYDKRGGFEYWGHAASWLPIEEYRYFHYRKRRMRERSRGWFDSWNASLDQNRDLYQHVLDRIRAEGPLGSSAFEDPRERRGTWWDWKPAKLVLEDLFDRGDLMCLTRTDGFARIYDLPERVLPPGLDTSDPGEAESHRHLLLRAFEALGVGTAADAADYFRQRHKETWRPALRDLVESGQIVPVAVEGWKEPAYATPAALAGPLRTPKHRPTLLSPFDNLVCYRERLERLFGFFYRIEIYTPEAKRTFGYYVLPLLVDGQIVGRADLKLDRPQRVLRCRRLALDGNDLEPARAALADFAAHLGADRYDIERLDNPS
jgi:uncharacterized protein YcaQ